MAKPTKDPEAMAAKWKKAYEFERDLRNEQQRKRIEAENELRHLQNTLDKKYHCEPSLVDDDEAECDICWTTLDFDWSFCPGCGAWIDWNALRPPEPDEGYLYDVKRDEELLAKIEWQERLKRASGGDD